MQILRKPIADSTGKRLGVVPMRLYVLTGYVGDVFLEFIRFRLHN